jgi:hypothetical protein
MTWVRRRYRGNKVWVLVDEAEHAVLDDRGLASLRYKPDDERTYTIRASEIAPVGAEPPDDTIHAWVALAAEPDRVGAVLGWRDQRREISRALDEGLTAEDPVVRALVLVLGEIRRKDLPVRLHVEGADVLERRARTGPGYVLALATAVARFADLAFVEAASEEEILCATRLARAEGSGS